MIAHAKQVRVFQQNWISISNICSVPGFDLQPLWTKWYLPVSQERWTLTPNDELYFLLFQALLSSTLLKEARRLQRLFDSSHKPLGGSTDLYLLLKGIFLFQVCWKYPQTSISIASFSTANGCLPPQLSKEPFKEFVFKHNFHPYLTYHDLTYCW